MFHVEHKIMKLEKELVSTTDKRLDCTDFLVSGESFELLFNEEYNLLVTTPLPENLSKYYESEDYISHSRKKKGLIPYLYHLVRKYSLKKKERLISSFGLEKKMLDVGCGTGSFLAHCSRENWNAFGTEPNSKARAIAQESGHTIQDSLENLTEKDFSIITLWHVLEHIPNLEETIVRLQNKLVKNGRIILAVPNFESWDAKHYGEFWAAYDVPRHIWHFSKRSIQLIFERHGMVVEKILPMKFDSFYVSMLSEKHSTGKNKLFRAFLNGWTSNRKAKKENNYSSLIYVIKNA